MSIAAPPQVAAAPAAAPPPDTDGRFRSRLRLVQIWHLVLALASAYVLVNVSAGVWKLDSLPRTVLAVIGVVGIVANLRRALADPPTPSRGPRVLVHDAVRRDPRVGRDARRDARPLRGPRRLRRRVPGGDLAARARLPGHRVVGHRQAHREEGAPWLRRRDGCDVARPRRARHRRRRSGVVAHRHRHPRRPDVHRRRLPREPGAEHRTHRPRRGQRARCARHVVAGRSSMVPRDRQAVRPHDRLDVPLAEPRRLPGVLRLPAGLLAGDLVLPVGRPHEPDLRRASTTTSRR